MWNMADRYYRTDFTMYALQKSPNARFTDCPTKLDLYTVPICAAWISIAIGGTHKAETVEQSFRQWSWIAFLNFAGLVEATNENIYVWRQVFGNL